jgi:luciferase-like monooxygenase
VCFRLAYMMLTHRGGASAESLPGAETSADSVHDRIIAEAGSWDEVTTGPGRFGSTRFLVGRRELGHLHGDSLFDFPLPPARKQELLAQGRVEQHRYTPEKSGWVSLRISEEADVETAIELLHEQHHRAIQRRSHAV